MPRVACITALLVAALAASVIALLGPPHPSADDAFKWLRPSAPMPGWTPLVTPTGAELARAPWFNDIAGDAYTASAAIGPAPRYVAYLNITPQQGMESLAAFPMARLEHLHDEDTSVREIAAITRRPFGDATVSCVEDTYRTRIGATAYREIACLIDRGSQRSGDVFVAAALANAWHRYAPNLERSIASAQIR